MDPAELEARMEVVERLTALFKAERLVHLAVTTVSLAILIASFLVLLYRKQAGQAELTMMFGSSGLITYSASRLLYMWTQAVRIIVTGNGGGK